MPPFLHTCAPRRGTAGGEHAPAGRLPLVPTFVLSAPFCCWTHLSLLLPLETSAYFLLSLQHPLDLVPISLRKKCKQPEEKETGAKVFL